MCLRPYERQGPGDGIDRVHRDAVRIVVGHIGNLPDGSITIERGDPSVGAVPLEVVVSMLYI